MYAIVGLGNPGEEYAATRHNLGFSVVEKLSRRLSAERPAQHRWSLCAVARFQGRSLILAQPLTYMNLSGKAVMELCNRYSLTPDELIIAHDDLDLTPGLIRLQLGGGSAGHRGVQSVIDTLGTNSFIRLRIGIGKPPQDLDGADYVLEQVLPEEQEQFDQTVERASQAALAVVYEGLERAMNKFNQALYREE